MGPVDMQPIRPMRVRERVEPAQPVQAPKKAVNGEKDVEVTRRELPGAGEPPVDVERVNELRQAIADGNYPLLPEKIADAMIAAKLILRNTP